MALWRSTYADAKPLALERAVSARCVRAGRFVSWPRPRRAKLIVLEYMADCFTMGQTYTEAQVNESLRTFHHDFAAARRYLVDEGFPASRRPARISAGNGPGAPTG